jgi:hypothetical protein
MTKKTTKTKTRATKKAAVSTVAPIDPFETLAETVKAPTTKARRPKASKAAAAKAVAVEPKSAKAPKRPAAKKAEPLAAKPRAKKVTAKKPAKKTLPDITPEIAAAKPKVELSPVFKALAEPELPELPRENRARLMMQSPTELYFYWSVGKDPYHLLRDAFGDLGSYTLVLKLNDLRRGTEEIHRVEGEGSWWFAVEPDGEYRAEIGFYAPNRPYFRVIYSNTVETPRRSPSPHAATQADWKVTAHKFAEVLDVAGFGQDAFDVAIAGDDHVAARDTAHMAFARFVGSDNGGLDTIAAEDLRYSLLAVASGLRLEDLRWRVSPAMFAILQSNADKLEAGRAMNVLNEHFDIDGSEFVEEHYGPAVHGASVVNFPRTLKPRKALTKYNPLSSHSIQ